jgi:hypothetical protein
VKNYPPIYVFRHIGIDHISYRTISHWEEVVREQEQYLKESGLIKAANRIIKSKEDSELKTLRKLYEHCLREDCYVLYIHTKALTWPKEFKDKGTATRRGFQDAVISNWKHCVEKLEEYDAVGINWREGGKRGGWNQQGWEHITGLFLGTFWWSKSQYIKTLRKDWDALKSRFDEEKWIGMTSNLNAKYFGIETENQYHLIELLGDRWEEWNNQLR